MKKETVEKLSNFDVVSKYLEGATTQELADQLKMSPESIRKFLLANNVVLRNARKRKSLREIPPVGQKFGQWTVISTDIKSGNEISTSNKSRNLYWLCKCVCGHVEWKKVNLLKSGQIKACRSCCQKTYLSKDGEILIDSFLQYKFDTTKKNIPTRKNRGRRNPLTFNITLDDVINLYESQNKKCALSGISIAPVINKTAHQQNLSIDRIDSFQGYEPDNIQLVDKRINMMKGSLSNEEFIELCTAVAINNNKLN